MKSVCGSVIGGRTGEGHQSPPESVKDNYLDQSEKDRPSSADEIP